MKNSCSHIGQVRTGDISVVGIWKNTREDLITATLWWNGDGCGGGCIRVAVRSGNLSTFSWLSFYGCLSFSLMWGVQAVFACFWSGLFLLLLCSVLSFLFSRFPPLVFSLVPPSSCSLLPDYPDVLHLPLVSPPPLTCGFKPPHFHTEFAALLSWTTLISCCIAVFIHLFLLAWLLLFILQSFLTNIFYLFPSYYRLQCMWDWFYIEPPSSFGTEVQPHLVLNVIFTLVFIPTFLVIPWEPGCGS